jgi:hypothetical protein
MKRRLPALILVPLALFATLGVSPLATQALAQAQCDCQGTDPGGGEGGNGNGTDSGVLPTSAGGSAGDPGGGGAGGAASGGLPFTGFMAIPILLIGALLAGFGLWMRKFPYSGASPTGIEPTPPGPSAE